MSTHKLMANEKKNSDTANVRLVKDFIRRGDKILLPLQKLYEEATMSRLGFRSIFHTNSVNERFLTGSY